MIDSKSQILEAYEQQIDGLKIRIDRLERKAKQQQHATDVFFYKSRAMVERKKLRDVQELYYKIIDNN